MENSNDLKALFHDALVAMFESNINGEIVDLNIALVHMLGYESKKEVFESIKNIDNDIYVSNIDRKRILIELDKTNDLFVYETKFRKKESEIIDVKLSVWSKFDHQNRKIGRIGIVENITTLVQNKNKEQEQKHRYKTLFEYSNDAIIILEADKLIEWNNKACQMFLGETKCSELPTFKSLHPEKQPDGRNSVEKGSELIKLTLDDKPQYFEWVHKRLNGELFYAEVSLSPLDKKRKITQALVRDVSARKAVEERIKNSEQMYRQLVELAPDGIFTLNENGIITSVNEAFCKLGGYDRSKYQNIYFKDAFDLEQESMTKAATLFQELKDKDGLQSAEIEWTHKNGSKYNGVARAISFQNYKKERIILVILRDTTEQKEAVDEIISRGALLKSIFDSIPMGVWVINKDNMIISQSGLAKKDWGDYIGKHIDEFPRIETSLEYESGIVKDVFKGKIFEGQQTVRVNGKEKHYKRISAPYYKNNRIDGFVAFSMDITELVEHQIEIEKHRNNLEYLVKERTEEVQALNEELRSSNEQLEYQRDDLQNTLEKLRTTQNQLVHSEKMASIGILTAGIAHEINNPVNFINSGTIGLEHLHNDFINSLKDLDTFVKDILNESSFNKYNKLKEKLQISDAIDRMPQLMDAVKIGVDRIVNIVKSLRTFSRMDSEEKVEVDVNDTIDSSLTIMFNKYKHRIEIIKKLDEDSVIKAFPGKLGQVILNLIMNAIQAIEDKGSIEIQTKKESSKNNFDIIISDDGIGMDSETQKKMFDPFYTTKDPGEGTGLGMSIVHSIIKEHNGKIVVNSKIGFGTKIHISLPVP